MRGFIAINLPADVRAALHAAASSLRAAVPDVRWVEPGSWHLTLMFLGQVQDERVAAINDALAVVTARHEPFELRLARAGAFPNPRRPRVWWIGVEASPPLLGLQRDVAAAMAELGFEPEARAYTPHLTIGRARGARGAGPDATSLLAAFDATARFPVGVVDLMESRLLREGARYSIVNRARLGPAHEPYVDVASQEEH